MGLTQALILGVLQGATEFVPISSSGHLVIVPWLLGWGQPSLLFDTTVHWGTLLAVVVYFRRDLWELFTAWLKTIRERSLADPKGRLAWLLLLGNIPAGLMGLFLKDFFESLFADPLSTARFLLVTGTILALSEWMGKRNREVESMGWVDALAIGVAQGAAILPGISRSGATIAAGLWFGMGREAAARFSFLLSVPIVFAAGMLKLKDAFEVGFVPGEGWTLALGFLAAAVSGYLCIHYLLEFLRRRSLYVFAVYCWLAGLFAIIVFVTRAQVM